MRKMSYFVIFIVAFICFSIHAYADSLVIVNGNSVRFRTDSTTNSNIISELNKGEELKYLESKSGSGCSGPWYKA